MKNRLFRSFLLLTFLFGVINCDTDLEENTQNQDTLFVEDDLSVKSLEEINDAVLSSKIEELEKQINLVWSNDYQSLFDGYDLSALSLNKESVILQKQDDTDLYIFEINIPKDGKNKTISQHAYLTISYRHSENILNKLAFGHQLQHKIYFDSDVHHLNNHSYKNSSKPSNIPSKAPKSVICSHNWNGSAPSAVASYCCPSGCGSSYGPAPIEMLARLFPRWYDWIGGEWVRRETIRPLPPEPWNGTHNASNLEILADPNDLSNKVSFLSYFGYVPYPFNKLRSEIGIFYGKIYVTVNNLNFVSTVPDQKLEGHIHKQAFVDSFFKWLFEMQDDAPATYAIVGNNNNLKGQLFSLLASYNVANKFSEGVYIDVVDGQNSSNQDQRLLSCVSDYLLTSEGWDFITNTNQNLSVDDYRSALDTHMLGNQVICQ